MYKDTILSFLLILLIFTVQIMLIFIAEPILCLSYVNFNLKSIEYFKKTIT